MVAGDACHMPPFESRKLNLETALVVLYAERSISWEWRYCCWHHGSATITSAPRRVSGNTYGEAHEESMYDKSIYIFMHTPYLLRQDTSDKSIRTGTTVCGSSAWVTNTTDIEEFSSSLC